MTPTKNQAAAAKEVFASNPEMNTLHVCSDDQCFEREDSAIEHEKTVLGHYPGPDEMPVKIERNGVEVKTATAAELIAKIEAATSVDEANEIVGDDTRKSVLAALKAKIAELAEANPPHGAGGEE